MTEALPRGLHEPRRNKYFYGKLLDVSHFQMEQCYGIDKRRLLNRLALGSGVLCGLNVTAGTDGTVCIAPGVAIDGDGREIIVSAPSIPIPPDQPTDANGLPSGDKLTGGQSTICLCYAECDAEPTAVYVSECDGVATTAASTTVERYRVIVRPGLPASEPPSLTAEQRNAIFPGEPPPGYDRRIATEETLAIACAPPPGMSCVVLATVTLPAEGAPQVIDNYTYRAEVFSNTVLFELIAALADRVDACCAALHPAAPHLAITDGDHQSAEVGQPLPAPVHLLVSDPNGNPVDAAEVTVATDDADAEISVDGATFAPSATAKTAADGVVTVEWHLGSTPGDQHFTATLAAGGANVTAGATATQAPQATPPVVVEVYPANGERVDDAWRERSTISLRFDQAMEPAGLANPDPWLRAWVFPENADGQISDGTRVRLEPVDDADGKATYRLEQGDFLRFTVIVVGLGSSPEIVSAGPNLALDAEYRGTELGQEQLDALWESNQFVADAEFRSRVKDSGQRLPSGDGTPGGRYFNSFFTAALGQ